MNQDELKTWFLALSDGDKQIFLARVSHYLTLDGRYFGSYLFGESQIRGFKGLNELQHQISSHIAALGSQADRYPDDVLWQILKEKAAAYGLGTTLDRSLAKVQESWRKRGDTQNSDRLRSLV